MGTRRAVRTEAGDGQYQRPASRMDQHGRAAANLVHQRMPVGTANQEPEEHHGGEQVRGAVGRSTSL